MINKLTTDQDDLYQLLEQSIYKSQKPTKTHQVITKPKSSFQIIYNQIKQMRIRKDAPVDIVGAEQLFSKNAPIELQRFQILCSLMLSPQTKDEATAKCMTRLLEFQIKDVADMEVSDLKQLIYEVNFNATKAERIKEMARHGLLHGMPKTLEETVRIKGVGEKIGLLYMQIAFNEVLGIAVDVNMVRICNRLGICKEKSPKKLRLELEGLVDQNEWGNVNGTLVGFGQQICLPGGREKCGQCLLRGECEYYKNKNELKKM